VVGGVGLGVPGEEWVWKEGGGLLGIERMEGAWWEGATDGACEDGTLLGMPVLKL
jgi:hypothetical protein